MPESEKYISYAAAKWHLYRELITDKEAAKKAFRALSAIPAADVRPVVLCRDCKYCRKVDEYEYWCDGFYSPARLVRKDDFCSHGKAKE